MSKELINRFEAIDGFNELIEKLNIELATAKASEDELLVLAIKNQISAYATCVRSLCIKPTAYDVDKVVAQLDKEAREHIRKSTSPFDLHAGLHLGYLHSIAIVKEGGQNDRN